MKSGQKLEKLKEVIDQHHFHASDPLDLLCRAGALTLPPWSASSCRQPSASCSSSLTTPSPACRPLPAPYARRLTITSALRRAILEPVHQMQMKKLGLKPFVELDQNLDQGMGSAMGLTMLDASVQMMKFENLK